MWIGVPWRGGTRTGGNGGFDWRGVALGGHAVELSGYDLAAANGKGLVWVNNSWEGWGTAGGVGYTYWSGGLLGDLSARALASGQSEAVVFEEVEWEPVRPEPLPPVPIPGPARTVDVEVGGVKVRLTVEVVT